jgi:3-dehydroquinate dehydratase/shikimate dehydrogenase
MKGEVTFLAVSIAVREAGELDRAVERAASAVKEGARLVEWRVDGLARAPEGVEAAGTLVARSPAPSIVTCRGRPEGGEFAGDEGRRAAMLEALILGERAPRYVDIELAAWQGSEPLRRRITEALDRSRRERDIHPSLILSVHDLERRPVDLLRRLEVMAAEPACAVVKVAWHARSLRDNLEALDLLAERSKPMISLCTGRFGLLSRVLAPKFGGLLVYAADRAGGETAPGQPTVADLRMRYRFEQVRPGTRVYGVVGWPIEHSLSPAIHNAAFDAVDHDGVYLPLPVPAEYEHFKATVGALLDHDRLGLRGASVTAPHKEHLLRFVGERDGRVEAQARRIGAANTLSVGDDGLPECLNTDAPAALEALCAGMGIGPSGLAGKTVAVIGAGGAGRAVAAAVSHAGARVTVFDVIRWRVEALANAFNGQPAATGEPARVVAAKPQALTGSSFDVYVNCTPLGMAGGPGEDQSPLPEGVPLGAGVTVFDTVYTPRRTPLIARAEAAGARVIPGMEMFLRQAAMQFEGWTGIPAPLDAFKAAALEAI